MTAPASLTNLTGHWTGTKRLWVTPNDPVRESETRARVTLAAQGRFLTIAYTWAYEGAPQDGLLLLGSAPKAETLQAVWIDSWHMGHDFMHCQGAPRDDGVIAVDGTYAAPPGPDWGWRIEVEPARNNAFRLLMYNLMPDGPEMLAVEAAFSRQP